MDPSPAMTHETALWLGLGLAALGAAAVALLGQGTRGATLAGLAVAAAMVAGFGPGVVAPLALFVLGAGGLTRLGRAAKEAKGAAEANRGRRGIANVLAKLGIPAALGLVAAASTESRVWCALAAAGSLAGAFADTAATEVGPLLPGPVVRWSGGRFSRAAHGSLGGVSLGGLLAGAAAAAAVALTALGFGVVESGAAAVATMAAGFAACVIESFVGGSRFGIRLGHFGRNVLVSALSAGLAAAAATAF
ncbi:MAG TPA: DUF92 domain-containing protein [Candidatus Eisenbacteria bacterium]|nr:DUF92 domain-containing protein [Candidatus Eisenbacteria bacterium]